MTYRFRPLDDSRLSLGTARLSVPQTSKWHEYQQAGKTDIYTAEFRGALLKLFGAPQSSTSIAEQAFKYIIEASDDVEHLWILTAYEGPSGPAIGGNTRDQTIYPVAAALLNLIETTPPDDFEAAIYDSDTDYTVIYGCKDGRCYAQERRGRYM
jgi:hypothetical protein